MRFLGLAALAYGATCYVWAIRCAAGTPGAEPYVMAGLTAWRARRQAKSRAKRAGKIQGAESASEWRTKEGFRGGPAYSLSTAAREKISANK